MSVIKISKENFASEVLNSDKPVLLDFRLVWALPYGRSDCIGDFR